jgi:MFS family permease
VNPAAIDQLLTLNHEIRQVESHLEIARRRRRLSNVSFVFGPVLLAGLYGLWWIPKLDRRFVIIIGAPLLLVALLFAVATVVLKFTPGGPPTGEFAFFSSPRERVSEYNLELQISRQQEERKRIAADAELDEKVRRIAYKNESRTDIERFRLESTRYRRVNNLLQGVLIVGSLAATGASALVSEVPDIRWATLGLTFLVGISSGFMGYYKYKERSFYLQQTADSIESEWEAYEVGVGRYKRIPDEGERLAELVEEIHKLKTEQKRRQQNLEQPPDSRGSQDH